MRWRWNFLQLTQHNQHIMRVTTGRARRSGRIETKMDIYGKWDVRILAVLIIGGLIAGWMIG